MTSFRHLVAAEIRKVTSTRSFLGLTAALVVVLLVLVSLVVNLPVPDNVRVNGVPGGDKVGLLFAQASTVSLFALVAGILIATSEFRYGTIVVALVANPSVAALVAAKIVVAIAYGLALGGVAAAVIVGIGLPWLSQSASVAVPPDMWEQLARQACVATLWGALGVGIGVLVRSQVVAIVGALVWSFVVENLVLNFRPALSKWMLAGVDGALTGGGTRELLAVWPALGLFMLYVAIAGVTGAVRLAHSDV